MQLHEMSNFKQLRPLKYLRVLVNCTLSPVQAQGHVTTKERTTDRSCLKNAVFYFFIVFILYLSLILIFE